MLFRLLNSFLRKKSLAGLLSNKTYVSLISVLAHKLQMNKPNFIFREYVAPFFKCSLQVIGFTFSKVIGKFVDIVFIDNFI